MLMLAALAAAFAAGCDGGANSTGRLDAVWGRQGISPGRLQKPRAMAIDDFDRIYIVDMTARIQVFDTEGRLLGGPWKTPAWMNGRPTGLSIARDGRLLVADTHQPGAIGAGALSDRVGSPGGGETGETPLTAELLEDEVISRPEGTRPDEFGLVTDAVKDSHGNIYISEYGDFDRIQKFSPAGEFLLQWGGHGPEPGRFRRPQNMAIDDDDSIWVADACNHRIQVFDTQGKLLKIWGSHGTGPGELSYPYDLVLAGEHLYVCEFGNNRVQKFTRDGRSLGTWGTAGRREGQLHNPWALVRDSKGMIYVLDTNNHRVQRVVF